MFRSCSSVEDARQMLQDVLFDAALIDTELEGGGGIMLATMVAVQYRDTRLVVFTSEAEPGAEDAPVASGTPGN